jgi:hypothetical protein
MCTVEGRHASERRADESDSPVIFTASRHTRAQEAAKSFAGEVEAREALNRNMESAVEALRITADHCFQRLVKTPA